MDFLVYAAERKFEEEEDEELELPPRLDPVAVLERVRDLLNRDLGNISPLDISDMVQDVEDCLHYRKYGLVEESRQPLPRVKPLEAVPDEEPDPIEDIPF
jgi:hypothetical protein